MVKAEDFIQTPIKTVPEKSGQEIFDGVVRKMLAQKLPALRLGGPQVVDGVVQDPEPTDYDIVSFNLEGRVSPAFAFFTRDDLRSLQKEMGYERLQYMGSGELGSLAMYYSKKDNFEPGYDEWWREVEEYRWTTPVLRMWEHRGIPRKHWEVYCRMQDAHDGWGDRTRYFLDDYTPEGVLQHSTRILYDEFVNVAGMWRLNREVLKFGKP